MSYREVVGNLFNTKAQALVNTVNCVGAMGKGIALEFRRRFPEMYKIYRDDCIAGKLIPGRIYSYPQPSGILILNFAIKDDWKQPSKLEWIESCLRQFISGYKQKGIQSIAFPWMGAMNGGIPLEIIQSTTRRFLENLKDIDIEVYTFDADAKDPLFDRLERIALSDNPSIYLRQSELQPKSYSAIIDAVKSGKVKSLARLIDLRIVGDTSIDKLYLFLTNFADDLNKGDTGQLPLF